MKPTKKELEFFLTAKARAEKTLLWDRITGEWPKNPVGRPRQYWGAMLGSRDVTQAEEGKPPPAPCAWFTRKDAIAAAERFRAKCKEALETGNYEG